MEFQHIGKVCTIQECKQKDFLPYKCSCCEKIFCQEHFRQESHNCELANKFAKKAIECPFCLKTIKYQGTHSDTEALDIHQATECDENNREKVLLEKRKVTCEQGKKCKQTLTDLNTFVCKICDRQLCLKHRIPEEHICERIKRNPEGKKIVQVEDRLQQCRLDKKAQENPNIIGGTLNQRREYTTNQYQSQTNSQYQQQQIISQQNQQQQLNERSQQILMRQQQQQQYQQQNQQQQQRQQQQQQPQQQTQQGFWSNLYQQLPFVNNNQSNPTQQQQQSTQPQQGQQLQQQYNESNSNTQQQQNSNQRVQPTNYRDPSREICDVCGRSFESIIELLSHAESVHQPQPSNTINQNSQQNNNFHNNKNGSSNNNNTSNYQTKEVCNVCGKSFNGFEELISHAEEVHFVQSN